MNVPFIETNEALAEYCQTLQTKKVIALDTEFERVRTFYPKPGLFQVNDGETVVLIDPCVITQWDKFRAVLTDSGIIKVFHACDEDIELLYHFLGVTPWPVFDTQIAAALCGYDYCMGYQRLVKAMLNVDLEKSSSRSDWMKRPLTEKQLHYAVDDVRYLLQIYEVLHDKVKERDLLAIIEEEYVAVTDNIKNDNYDNACLRIKQGWKLSPQQFAVLKALATWREETMRKRDLPRNWVARNEALMTLASQQNWSHQRLFSVEGLPAATVKNEGESLLSIINRAAAEQCEESMPRPIKPDRLMGRLKAVIKEQADELGIAEQMLSKKSYNETLYRVISSGNFASLPDTIKGWRRAFYEKAAAVLQR